MTYSEFKNKVLENVKKRYMDGYSVSVCNLTKNNNTSCDGLLIRDNSVNVTPTIYLNPYYEMFNQSDDFEMVVEHIIDAYEKNKKAENLDVSFFLEYSKVKNQIVYKLINKAMNSELLQDIPYIDYMDLAVIFYYNCNQFDDCIDGNASILIRNSHVELWKIDKFELWSAAMRNTKQLLGLSIRNIFDIVKEQIDPEELKLQEMDECPPFFVATNNLGLNGASCILYEGMLRDFARTLDMDFFIIPSSVHEIILVPALQSEMVQNAFSLKEMIEFVNQNEVAQQDVLSNNLYFYSREKELLSIYE